jgi:hypothetical protein
MSLVRDLSWFKSVMEPKLKDYEVQYRFFEEGDFGALNQVEFNSEKMGGEIDFWSSGWVSIHLVDYVKSNELINVFLKPEQYSDRQKYFAELEQKLLA